VSLRAARLAEKMTYSIAGFRGMCLKVSASAAVTLLLSPPLPAQLAGARTQSLTDMSLEDLMNLQVTSVSRKEQTLSRTPAAIYVITQEEIRRSGATNIPDLLRMAPGVDIAQIDANAWAISIRGLTDRYANKVLVLIDGRSVYSPVTGGVFWDQQDVPLEDIDRIEIIRGPGGTVWGANAMNGVINIITKSAKATQGAVVSAGGGSQGTAQGFAQYGGKVGDTGAYRVFGNYSNRGNLTASDGRTPAADGWNMMHGGFRSDWDLSPRESLTVQGDLLQTDESQTIDAVFSRALPLEKIFSDAVTVKAGDLMARWKRTLANESEVSLQVYYDRYDRLDQGLRETLNTFDADFEHHLALGARQDVVWGAGYRVTADGHVPGYGKTYDPLARTNSLFSTFVQDEITLADSLWLTIGSKIEHNAYTGFEFEPSVQLLWQPNERHTLWLSLARAVTQTSREQTDLRVDLATFPTHDGGFGVLQLSGDPNAPAQELYDFEVGYRAQLSKRFSLDTSIFMGSYSNLQGAVVGTPFFTMDAGPPHLVLPLFFTNIASAHTLGAEATGTWKVTSRWKINPSFSAIHLDPVQVPGETHSLQEAYNAPQIQARIQSSMNLGKNMEWDISMGHVGRLRDGGDGDVPAYNRLDTRWGWKIGEFTEISLVGQNLLTPLHAEFHNAYEVRRTLVERSAFAKITWKF